ncbi:MAG: trypsin-like peptidase domain-containing protein [Chloroflexi bacterium]|nr:trypsin-like peptidase domain-containing protein [Chloroflexota bacterium]
MKKFIASLSIVTLLVTLVACTRGAASPGPQLSPSASPVAVESTAKETAEVARAVASTSLPAAVGPTTVTVPSFTQVVAKVRPAVVSIAALVQVIDPFFRLVPSVQSGSGVFIDPSGYVVTNEHVVANATRIEVKTDDEQTFVAELVGKDATTDLALLKISAPMPFPYLRFAQPDSYRIGDWVIAIGNALGLPGGPTVTVGVIGALDRTINVDSQLLGDLVQTDAAINEGNSGGPLIDLNGDIVGINTIISRQGQGIGFATSSFTVAPVVRALREQGRVHWAWLGVGVDDLSTGKALELDLPVRKGVVILQVVRNSPASRAGIQPGDVIVSINGAPITRLKDLQKQLREEYQAGQEVTVRILRSGRETDLPVVLTEMPRR